MRQETSTLLSAVDGLPLSVLTLIPDQAPTGIIQVSHGMSEHKERYLPFLEYLCARGLVCVIHDHRGHGASVRSPQDLGYFYADGDAALVRDLHQVSHSIRERFPKLPLALFGHSMGSLAARCYLKEYPRELSALIVCGSPAFHPAAGAGAALCSLLGRLYGDHHRSRLITALAFGPYEKKFPGEGPNAWLSANRENVTAYNRSPLCGFLFTTNGYRALFRLLARTYSKKEWARARRAQPFFTSLPIFFIAGEDDPCTGFAAGFQHAVRFLYSQGFSSISQKRYPGMRHEILNETGREAVWEDIAAFLSSALHSAQPAD